MTTQPSHMESNHDKIQSRFAVGMYTDRASRYDTATGGWHAQLGQDFARWIDPPPGSSVLDLACGTGLVTLPMAVVVGPNGVVVGIDITTAMLDLARQKQRPEGAAQVQWIEADITEGLLGLEPVQKAVEEKGGFNVISCCSALVMLEDPKSAVRQWAALLKEGGG